MSNLSVMETAATLGRQAAQGRGTIITLAMLIFEASRGGYGPDTAGAYAKYGESHNAEAASVFADALDMDPKSVSSQVSKLETFKRIGVKSGIPADYYAIIQQYLARLTDGEWDKRMYSALVTINRAQDKVKHVLTFEEVRDLLRPTAPAAKSLSEKLAGLAKTLEKIAKDHNCANRLAAAGLAIKIARNAAAQEELADEAAAMAEAASVDARTIDLTAAVN